MGHTTQFIIVALSTVLLAACGEEPPRILPPVPQDWRDEPDEPDEPVADPLTSDRDTDGWLDVAEVAMGTDPDAYDSPCASARVATDGTLETIRTKLDIVVLVDTSGSMVEEMPFIREGLLSTIERAERSDGDIHLIVVADHEVWCDIYNLDPFVQCYELPSPSSPNLTYIPHVVDSWNTFEVFLKTYAESWGDVLRDDASIVALNITDEYSNMPWSTFEQKLRATAQDDFFPGGLRGYTWNSVTGVALGSRTSVSPSTGIVDETCETAVDAGLEYQGLSRVTGGLRFSVCGDNDYTGLFDEIVLASTTPAECAIALSSDRGRIDMFRSTIQLEVEGAPPEVLPLVSRACDERGYYVTGDYMVLCEEVCDELEGASVKIRAGAECACETSPAVGCLDERF